VPRLPVCEDAMKKPKPAAELEEQRPARTAPRPFDRTARERSGRLLSGPAAVIYTGLPYSTLCNAARHGHLPVVRLPGSDRMWFDRKDLDRAIEAWKERLG
jgi:hypothetical protein